MIERRNTFRRPVGAFEARQVSLDIVVMHKHPAERMPQAPQARGSGGTSERLDLPFPSPFRHFSFLAMCYSHSSRFTHLSFTLNWTLPYPSE